MLLSNVFTAGPAPEPSLAQGRYTVCIYGMHAQISELLCARPHFMGPSQYRLIKL